MKFPKSYLVYKKKSPFTFTPPFKSSRAHFDIDFTPEMITIPSQNEEIKINYIHTSLPFSL